MGRSTIESALAAVVPTFHPEGGLQERLRLLGAQVPRIVVVDDGSGAAADEVLGLLVADGHEVVRHDGNRGIAAALNTGLTAAFAGGATHVLTLDQDTELTEGYVAACLATFAGAGPATRLAVVCADVINDAPSIPATFTPEGFGIVPEAIQSGMLIARDAVEDVGPFDEGLFIDLVDSEFCRRAAGRGWLSVISAGTRIRHELGELQPNNILGIPRRRDGELRMYEYHTPFRHYYIVRNTIDLALRFRRDDRHWVLSLLRRQIRDSALAVLAGPHRGKQLLAEIVGGVHGLVRRRGPIPPALRRLVAVR